MRRRHFSKEREKKYQLLVQSVQGSLIEDSVAYAKIVSQKISKTI
jgi:hypothetical protein